MGHCDSSSTVAAFPSILHRTARDYLLAVGLDHQAHVGGRLVGDLQLFGVEAGVQWG